MGTRPIAVVVTACVLLLTRQAHADRELEAQQLFDEGKALMAEHRLDEACKKFEASHRLAASAATLMNLGACQEAAGRLASAWGTFRQAASLATRTDPVLVDPSRKRADALQPRVSSLQISVPDSSRVAGLEIMRNGVVLDEAQWGSRQLVDGGEYEIVARAPGTVAWTAHVAVATELDRKEVEIPRLMEAAADGGGGGVSGSGGGVTGGPLRDEPSLEEPRGGKMTTLRKVAIGAAAGGVLALGGGVVLGLRAKGLQSESDDICPTTTCNDPEGLRLNRDARSTGTKATILFVAGGALAAAGVTLWILGAPDETERGGVGVGPLVGDGAFGVAIAGSL